MYRIYASNRIEHLCHKLATTLNERGLPVFAREVFVTQSAGMAGWIKTELTKSNGILAHFEFQNQDGLFGEIYRLIFGERLKNYTESIKYRIFRLLGSSEFEAEFPNVAEYYAGDELRRIQLAAKTADLFDQYQLYRNEMILKWSNGGLFTQNHAEEWQSWLWKRLAIESRYEIRQRVTEMMEDHSAVIRKRFPRISIFGVSIFTEFHLEFFRDLAKVTDIDFYICLPTESRQFRNDLLTGLGSKAAEQANIIRRILGDFTFESHANTDQTILGRIQNSLLNDSEDHNFTPDSSITVNNCFTPVREAECLYNYLLDLFERDRELNRGKENNRLKPGDILVMATDINKYGPYIRAVFRNAPVTIPFRISGASPDNEDTVCAAIEQILTFTEDDLTAEKVISLLESRRIKQRFGIRDSDYIRSAVNRANIRFGRVNQEEDDTRFVSWRYGLEKILLGYAMLTDDQFGNKYPFRDAESAAGQDLLRLKAFFDVLCDIIDAQEQPRPLSEWKKFLLEGVIEKCIFHDDFSKDDRAEISSVYKALSFIDNLDFNDNIRFAVFLEELKIKLFTETSDLKLNSGDVTVSSPNQVRGLPYRVICFVGLNDEIFPGKDSFMGFDLLGEGHLEGDRTKKEANKYLFLDTVISARENLYISYTGQNAKNGSEIPPSIAVDILEEYSGSEIKALKHPLHGFSAAYQAQNDRLFTYLYSGNQRNYEPDENQSAIISELSADSFIHFFQHPIEWYFKTVLKIKYDDPDDILPETELFTLDNIRKWQIKNDMLRESDENIDQYLQKGMKEGFLPLGNSGKVHIEEIVREIAPMKASYDSLVSDRNEKNVVIDLLIKNIPIRGIIDSIYGDAFIVCSFSSSRKHKVAAWLKTLLLSASGSIKTASFIDRYGQISSIEVPAPEEAKIHLEKLTDYLSAGSVKPLKFTLKAAEEALKASATREKVYNAIRTDAEGNSFQRIDPDPYVSILYKENYFSGLNDDDIAEIKKLAELLKLKDN